MKTRTEWLQISSRFRIIGGYLYWLFICSPQFVWLAGWLASWLIHVSRERPWAKGPNQIAEYWSSCSLHLCLYCTDFVPFQLHIPTSPRTRGHLLNYLHSVHLASTSSTSILATVSFLFRCIGTRARIAFKTLTGEESNSNLRCSSLDESSGWSLLRRLSLAQILRSPCHRWIAGHLESHSPAM